MSWLSTATDELVASLSAQLDHQKESVNPSQLKDLESKGAFPKTISDLVKSLQAELQRVNAALSNETAQNAILHARMSGRTQSTAQLGQDLLSDLSGLIFRNIEQTQGNTIFDCLQCGRGGSTLTHPGCACISNNSAAL